MSSNIDPKSLEVARLKLLVEIWSKTSYLNDVPEDKKAHLAALLDKKAIELNTTDSKSNPDEEYKKVVQKFLS